MGFLRKLAVKYYAKELANLVNILSRHDEDATSGFLVYGVWLRAIMELEGNLAAYELDNGELNPELHSYPIMEKELLEWIKLFEKKGDGVKAEVFKIWVHSLRAIMRPEISELAHKMWGILMRGSDNWDEKLKIHSEEYIRMGTPEDVVLRTVRHARAILNCLPPKQLA